MSPYSPLDAGIHEYCRDDSERILSEIDYAIATQSSFSDMAVENSIFRALYCSCLEYIID